MVPKQARKCWKILRILKNVRKSNQRVYRKIHMKGCKQGLKKHNITVIGYESNWL